MRLVDRRRTMARGGIGAGMGLGCLLWLSVPAMAQDTTAVRQDTTVQQDTIPAGVQGSTNPLTEGKTPLTGDDLIDASFPNSIPLFGTNIRLGIGGYVKADFIKDFDYVGDPYEFELGSIPVDGSPERALGGTTTFHAKESRVNFDLRSVVRRPNGTVFPLQIFVEFDWFFDAPSSQLHTRLRHAYGVIGRLLAGQTWNTSGDLSAIPGVIDFSGGDALYGGRVPQIRWQDRLGGPFTYAVALEQPAAQVDNPTNLEGSSRFPSPSFAGKIRWKASGGSTVQLGADVFPVRWSGPATAPNTTELAYALTLMSRVTFPVTAYHDAVLWGGGVGRGQAARIIALSWDGRATGAVSADGLELNPAWFAYVGYNHYWNRHLNSTVATHWAGTSVRDVQSDDTIERAGSVHANLIWFPYRLVSTGVEYMWGMRENKDGTRGTASRVQFMVKFKFH